jgi:hypothetical protein
MHLGAAFGVISPAGRETGWARGRELTKPNQTTNGRETDPKSETAGAKLRRREGNSPDHRLRSLRWAKCKRRWGYSDSQEVGLEAAILERVRNSSLVE